MVLLSSPQMPVDLSIAGSGLERAFLERTREVELAGVRVPVLSPEDLIVTKLLAFRPRDVDDILGILGEQRELDLDHITETVALVQEGLDDPDLMSRWQELLRTGRRRP